MRMWNIDPKLMCRQHLLGEHVEMHMFKAVILGGKSVNGYLKNGLLNLGEIKKRHDVLVYEMIRRGFEHKSPMNSFNEGKETITVSTRNNLVDLHKRCSACKELFIAQGALV